MGNQTSSEGGNGNGNGIKFEKGELKVLYKNFVKLDSNHSGLLEPKEFFDVEELKDNPIVDRLISVFDKNNDGKISFYEFVSGLSILTDWGIYNYLNNLFKKATSEDKLKIAFKIYDVNNDGIITNGDLFNCLKILVGENLTDIQIQQLVDRTFIAADKDMDGKISYEEFCEYCKDMKIAEMFSMKLF